MAKLPPAPSIFQKAKDLTAALLDSQLVKAKTAAIAARNPEADLNFGKAVTKDRSYYIGSQGYQEKPGAIGMEFYRQMAVKSSVISAIVKTQQNKVAGFAQVANKSNKKGFRIVLKDEKAALDKLREELFPEEVTAEDAGSPEKTGSKDLENNQTKETQSAEASQEIQKAEKVSSDIGEETNPKTQAIDESGDGQTVQDLNDVADSMEEEPTEIPEMEKQKILREELDRRTSKKRKALETFMVNCGDLKGRPFETLRWNMNTFLRAFVWDSLIYDQAAIEKVPKEAEVINGRFNIAYFQPIDGSTIRYASDELKKYKDHDLNANQDILYPEEELEKLEEKDALELDEDRLKNNEYKYVQVVRSRIQRAFTQDEMCLGIRNPVTDVFMNGYGLNELELLTALVSSHLHTEYYNRAYFMTGFSAKGILHIKANLNRSKLEELRRHWTHMVKGNRNSFQTPIMSGMDEIQWIPLTQNHSEMEFSLWLNYLIKMICAIYQIDPVEIGYGMKEEGGSGGGLGGDNTQEKLTQSKDKGFIPLMNFISSYINTNLIEVLDPDYRLEWIGLIEETQEQILLRQEKEVKFKKTVNEIRLEDDLPPIDGADNLILDPVYIQWLLQASPEALENQQAMANQESMLGEEEPEADNRQEDWQADEAAKENDHSRDMEAADQAHGHDKAIEAMKPKPAAGSSVKKSMPIKVEYYKVEE